MLTLKVIDRITKQIVTEKVFGGKALKRLYTQASWAPLKTVVSRVPLISWAYGAWQKLPFTKRKILPFIQEYGVDVAEFQDPVESFGSFNDFFIRQLKPSSRPIIKDPDVAVMPADARYLFFQDISQVDGFLVKGEKFSLGDLLQDDAMAKEFTKGSLLLARLCPFDYHRFHFPVAGIPSRLKIINGTLYSVNPIALKQNIRILTENKRVMMSVQSERFGKVIYVAIGATNVGSIKMTYTPDRAVQKGDEAGYFEFGASALAILFQSGKIHFDADLLDASAKGMEMRCLMGQSLGR